MAAVRISVISNTDPSNAKVIKVPAGSTLEAILKAAGEKLNIKARKLFLDKGAELEDVDMLRDDDVVYVSAGEPFAPKKGGKGDEPGCEMFSIAVMGPGSVGKSACTLQFVQGVFVTEYDPTIEDAYRRNMVVDELPCILDILDTAGQENYTALRSTWMRERDGFVLVFSVCERTTFDGLEPFYEQLSVMHEEKVPPLIIVGNKCDLVDRREVSAEEGRKLAESWGGEYIEASAKTSMNIEALFIAIARSVRRARAASGRSGGGPAKKPVAKKGWCVLL